MEDWTLEKCDCLRMGCDYFAAGLGDYGTSFSKEKLEMIRAEINKVLTD